MPRTYFATTSVALLLCTGHAALSQTPPSDQTPNTPPANHAVTQTITQVIELPATPREKKQRLRLWQDYLSQIVAKKKATLFFDVPADVQPPTIVVAKSSGTAAMKTLALGTRHTWQQINGVQTFARTNGDFTQAGINKAFAWVHGLQGDKKAALLSGKMGISQLSPDDRNLVLRLVSTTDKETALALSDAGNNVGLGITFNPSLEYTDPKTGEKKEITLRTNNFAKVDVPSTAPTDAPDTLSSKLDAAPEGELNFGKGAVKTLKEITTQAHDTFGVFYVVDDRVAENDYFVSGNYSQKDFEEILKRVTTVPPVVALPPKAAAAKMLSEYQDAFAGTSVDVTGFRGDIARGTDDLNAMRSQYGDKETIPANDFLQGRTVSVSDLAANRPGLAAHLATLGVPPGARVTLHASLLLAIKAEGWHPIEGTFTVGGQPASGSSPNQALFGL